MKDEHAIKGTTPEVPHPGCRACIAQHLRMGGRSAPDPQNGAQSTLGCAEESERGCGPSGEIAGVGGSSISDYHVPRTDLEGHGSEGRKCWLIRSQLAESRAVHSFHKCLLVTRKKGAVQGRVHKSWGGVAVWVKSHSPQFLFSRILLGDASHQQIQQQTLHAVLAMDGSFNDLKSFHVQGPEPLNKWHLLKAGTMRGLKPRCILGQCTPWEPAWTSSAPQTELPPGPSARCCPLVCFP